MDYRKHEIPILSALLAVLALAVFWQASGFKMLWLDDYLYTAQNHLVTGGLTASAIREAFTSIQHQAYMPVTMISYMAEVELFGVKPSVFHTTNILLHLLNTLLLFWFLSRATGSVWKSFFAAAIWSVHPLRAESVAWIAERKDVLAGFFFLAGLLFWCEYAKRRKPVLYAAALLSMLLGAASKVTVAVFPLILLLLDFWPLERLKKAAAKRLIAEKIPFLALSALFAGVTLFYRGDTVRTVEQRGVTDRLADVATSYLHYVKETFWPVGLFMENRDTFSYPSGGVALGAGMLLIFLTALSLRFRKSAPAVSAGWWWYLAALFPVSGVAPLDYFFVADHFTYLPHIGLCIAAVWGTGMLFARYAKGFRPILVSGAAIVAVLSVLCFRQVSVWRNDFVFFGHIDRMSGGRNPMAKSGLGAAHFDAGNYREAYDYFTAMLFLEPNFVGGFGNKGLAAAELGKYQEAAGLIKKQLEYWPGHKDLNVRLAMVLIKAGDASGGARKALENIRRWPGDREAWEAVNYLGGEARAREIAGARK